MNEKIKELADEAKQYAEDEQNNPLKIYTLDCFNEKFAELIVRECTNAVRDGTWEGDNFAARVEGVFGINHPTITFRDEE